MHSMRLCYTDFQWVEKFEKFPKTLRIETYNFFFYRVFFLDIKFFVRKFRSISNKTMQL